MAAITILTLFDQWNWATKLSFDYDPTTMYSSLETTKGLLALGAGIQSTGEEDSAASLSTTLQQEQEQEQPPSKQSSEPSTGNSLVKEQDLERMRQMLMQRLRERQQRTPSSSKSIDTVKYKNTNLIETEERQQVQGGGEESVFHSPLRTKIQTIKQQLMQQATAKPKTSSSSSSTTTTTSTTTSNTIPMNHTVAKTSAKKYKFASHILPSPRMTNATTIILVLSAQQQFEKRQAIRETWGMGHDNVYFVVAHSNCGGNITVEEPMDKAKKCQRQDHAFLLQEQLQFQDLIEIPFVEFYRGIPEKVVQAYHWTLTHLPQVQWLVKADDDMFVRVNPLQTYLRKYNPHVPMLIGKINPKSQVWRKGKWAETDYQRAFYPYWAQGSCGHVVSRSVATYIANHSSELIRYQGEDTSIGIWLQEAVAEHKLPRVEYIHSADMFTNQGVKMCFDKGVFMVGHDFKPEDHEQCMAQGDDDVSLAHAWSDSDANFPANARPTVLQMKSSSSSSSSKNRLGFYGRRSAFGRTSGG